MKLVPASVLLAAMAVVEPVLGQNFQNSCKFEGAQNKNGNPQYLQYQCRRLPGFADQCARIELQRCIGVSDNGVLKIRTGSDMKQLRDYHNYCKNCKYHADTTRLACDCTVATSNNHYPTSIHLSAYLSNHDGYITGPGAQCRGFFTC